MQSFSIKKVKSLYRQLFNYIKPFWLILTIGILANILYSTIDATFTYMMRPLLDKGLIAVDYNFIKKIPFLILIGVTLRGIISALGSYCMTWVARSVIKVLRQKVFAHITKLPASYYDKSSSGQLLSKILYDVEQVAQVSADALTDLVQNSCLIIGLLLVMFIICWQLSLMFLLTVPFIALIVNYTNKKVRRISHKVQKSMGEVTEIASETINGYRVVRIFQGTEYAHKKFNQATELARKNDMKVAAAKALNTCGVQLIIGIGITGIIIAAMQLATVITITAGSFLSIIAAMLQLIKPMKTLTTLNSNIQRGLAGAESIFNLLEQTTEKENGKNLAIPCRGEIKFSNVSFNYEPKQAILHNINLNIKAGEIIAIVGHSGSGKSTLISLLPHFYTLNQGDILLDGQSIKQISLASLRSQIALVSQDITLFNDSLANNIAYGTFNASREQIIRAAKLAYADEFIKNLPEDYDTIAGENGILLSGGQRQRIAIARAILKNAPILILDEATSALDQDAETMIQSALKKVMLHRTTLIVAHRLSTIKNAHKIIVLHHGRLLEQGTHQELLKLNGHYAQLYNHQHVNNIPQVIAE